MHEFAIYIIVAFYSAFLDSLIQWTWLPYISFPKLSTIANIVIKMYLIQTIYNKKSLSRTIKTSLKCYEELKLGIWEFITCLELYTKKVSLLSYGPILQRLNLFYLHHKLTLHLKSKCTDNLIHPSQKPHNFRHHYKIKNTGARFWNMTQL